MQPDFRHARSGSLSIGAQNGHPGPQQQGQQGQPGQPGQQGSQQGQGQGPHDATSPMPGAQARFDGPRSPPNTSHVPCKFFRQGACQAGNSCPFSHDIGTAIETVCKYFAKGNCKFGPKCANMHLLPDGRRVTYGKNGVIIGTAPVNHPHGPGQNSHLPGLGHRVNPAAYMQPSNSALTNSFLNASSQPQPQPQPQPPSDDRYDVHAADASYASNPTSAYGSPPGAGGTGFDELHALAGNGTSSLGQALRQAQQGGQTPQQQHRSLLGLSPMNANVLSVMDAPLPASFDSNGISHAARYGPWPSSVPSKFGLESPTPSLHNAKDERTSETLKMLHTSAFGDHLSPSSLLPAQPHSSHQHSAHHLAAAAATGPAATGTGTAAHHPKTASLLNGAALDDFGGKRILHSSSTRYAKPRLLSSSVPKVDRDWDTEFWFLEEDYVPANLANEVLTPQEKARRGSLRLTEPSGHALDGGSNNHNSHSDTPTPSASATKFGSPAGGGVGVAGNSPSRWSPWLQQRQRSSGAPLPGSSYGAGGAGVLVDDDVEPGSVGRSMKHAASAFGHVGSPLRNSLAGGGGGSGSGRHSADVHGGSTSSTNGVGGEFGHSLSGSLGGRGGGSGFGFGNGGGSGGDRPSMSVLSQQLQRTRLEGEGEGEGNGDDDDAAAASGQNAPPRPSSTSSSSTPSRLRPAAAARNPSASLSQAAVTQAAAAGIIGSSGGGGGGGGGRFPAPIDEEDPSFLFDMEVADDSKQKNGTAGVATASTSGPTSPSAATPATNSLWGYANIVKGGTGGPAKGGETTSR
ncbi:uncharacterized protein SPSK_01481 [Sporothrix schenckii 1099-18]|uniref:C3H1-type domain-containing protein n=1 Tax=Sporothrix schenckii 1099-18 TaxID=1397361 RepID=A0A0F2MEL5_SPOSC|nr:uncharacterized protein SPSK_01481 [Sporothrix schenckii 1099-18]KJR87514.1 hypothetical protein SPSK_01481 [Sporothrix schenckii 1099-18]